MRYKWGVPLWDTWQSCIIWDTSERLLCSHHEGNPHCTWGHGFQTIHPQSPSQPLILCEGVPQLMGPWLQPHTHYPHAQPFFVREAFDSWGHGFTATHPLSSSHQWQSCIIWDTSEGCPHEIQMRDALSCYRDTHEGCPHQSKKKASIAMTCKPTTLFVEGKVSLLLSQYFAQQQQQYALQW